MIQCDAAPVRSQAWLGTKVVASLTYRIVTGLVTCRRARISGPLCNRLCSEAWCRGNGICCSCARSRSAGDALQL